jgi:hypothetical protein
MTHHHRGSIRQGWKTGSAHGPQLVESAGKTKRREIIASPKERDIVVRRWLFYANSVTKLADDLEATRDAIENVLRERVYRLQPPSPGMIMRGRLAA